MTTKQLKSKIEHYKNKLDIISNIINNKELKVSYDVLKESNKTNQELLYFKTNGNKEKGLFIFSFPFFIEKLKDHEFKKMLGANSLNYQIYLAYNDLKKSCDLNSKCKGVKVSEIIDKLTKNSKSTVAKPKLLRRILTLSYYLKWDLKQDNEAFDTEYFIKLDNDFIEKQKQRFNLDVAIQIDENNSYLLFINLKGDLCLVLKEKNKFYTNTVEKDIFPYLQEVLNIKKITVE